MILTLSSFCNEYVHSILTRLYCVERLKQFLNIHSGYDIHE